MLKKSFLYLLLCSIPLFAEVSLLNYLPKVYDINATNEPKVFIVAGIHGDEYGGFLSAQYILSNIKIKKGHIRVIPYLNIKSIVVNFRYLINGGDLNDKFVFSKINKLDLPQSVYQKINYIKKSIKDFNPDVVLSLHSGWGYSYRDNKRWGNSIVIDEKEYKGKDLYSKANIVLEYINKNNRYKLYPYTLKVLNTFSNDVHIDMNDFSSWVLKSNFDVYSIESSKNQRIRTQIYNTTFALLEFLRVYGIEVVNKDELLSIDNIKRFLNSIRLRRVNFNIYIDGNKKEISCKLYEKKVIKITKGSKIEIKDIQINKMGYFITPNSRKNYQNIYTFKKNISFRINYFNIDKKRYDSFCRLIFEYK